GMVSLRCRATSVTPPSRGFTDLTRQGDTTQPEYAQWYRTRPQRLQKGSCGSSRPGLQHRRQACPPLAFVELHTIPPRLVPGSAQTRAQSGRNPAISANRDAWIVAD